jgi:hypothetical protein
MYFPGSSVETSDLAGPEFLEVKQVWGTSTCKRETIPPMGFLARTAPIQSRFITTGPIVLHALRDR